jgi:hypothetical protein
MLEHDNFLNRIWTYTNKFLQYKRASRFTNRGVWRYVLFPESSWDT